MKRNVGRPPVEPTSAFTTITLRVPAEDKKRLMVQAAAYDMTLTEYILTLIARDGSK
jgi:predicted HicB family RNase H-like nuclease